jgi:DNA-binding NarL/FixJ family response regulator
MKDATRVVVIDDHEIVRRGLVDLIEAENDLSVVGDAGTAAAAIDLARQHAPDVVLMDVRLPDGSGVEACSRIRRELPDTRVLMFTSFADPDALESALAAGASGFLLKRVHLNALAGAVRRVAAGETVLDTEAEELLEARTAGDSAVDPRLRKLSAQERKVLALIAEGKTNREIADAMDLAEKTVKNYVSNLLRKLDMTRRAEAAVFRAGLGE